ncbi:MAG: cache and HAMP domain-containing protein, partial [Cyanobacteria bacterium P01_G01_bin.38]
MVTHNFRSRSKALSLRWALIIPFVLQISAAVGLVGWVSLRNGQQSAKTLALQLNEEITTSVEKDFETFANTPHLFLQLNQAAFQTGNLSLSDLGDLEDYFWRQVQLVEAVDTLYFADVTGQFLLVKGGDAPSTYIRDAATAPLRHIYRLDPDGNRVEQIGSTPYDPRQRPWYQTALQVGEPTWSSIYLFAAEPVLGITPVLPIFDPRSKELQGVLAVDLTLTQLSDFLRSLPISQTGQAFIIEKSGAVVATSTTDTPFVETPTGRRRLYASYSNNPTLKDAVQYLRQQFGELDKVPQSIHEVATLQGDKHFIGVTQLQDGRGLDWLIIVTIPEADFMGPVYSGTRTTLILCMAALGGAIALGALTASWISRPIRQLSHAARTLPDRDFNPRVNTHPIRELKILAHAFNQMGLTIKQSFAALSAA